MILLPGAVLPAELAYGALIETLGRDVEAAAKDLEVYAGAESPVDCSLDTKVGGVMREADALGWERFHLVGSNPDLYEEIAERLSGAAAGPRRGGWS